MNESIKEAIICGRQFTFLNTLDADSKKLGYNVNRVILSVSKVVSVIAEDLK